MDNVVSFPPAEDKRLLWVCLCGCTTFRLFSDGHAECASCEDIANGEPDGWRERLPRVPADPELASVDSFAVKNIDDADVFLKRQARSPADIAAVVVLHSTAQISSWQRGDADVGWIRDQLDHAKTRLIGA